MRGRIPTALLWLSCIVWSGLIVPSAPFRVPHRANPLRANRNSRIGPDAYQILSRFFGLL
jgi:hypothetical protein